MTKFISKETLIEANPPAPKVGFKDGFDIRKVVKLRSEENVLAEFIGTGDFAETWYRRQRFEVAQGRREVPILYTAIYDTVVSADIQMIEDVNRLGAAQVIFTERSEGGEVRFVTVTSSDITVRQSSYAVGLEYTKELVMYNRVWTVANVERAVGQAYNALLNHAHLAPFVTYSYPSSNQTDGTALNAFWATDEFPLKVLRTLEQAIIDSKADTTNPRSGGYVLLVSGQDFFTWERALTGVSQQTYQAQSSALGMLSAVVAYDGWQGKRGKVSVSYPGVSAGKAYLIHVGNRDEDFVSLMRQPLQSESGNAEVSRYIREQTVWDTHFGNYANVLGTTQEITLPAFDTGKPPQTPQ